MEEKLTNKEINQIFFEEMMKVKERCFPTPSFLELLMRDFWMRFLLLVALPFLIALWLITYYVVFVLGWR